MIIQAAILITAISAMAYGLIRRLWFDTDFFFRPTGNVISAIGLTLVASVLFDLALEQSGVVLVALGLALYWLSNRDKWYAPKNKLTFEQVFDLIDEDDLAPAQPAAAAPVKAEEISEAEYATLASEPMTPEPTPTLIWKGA